MHIKRPLQALLIAPEDDMRRRILTGEKRITIREGARDYVPGRAMICCHLVTWCVQVNIVLVRHCALDQVTVEEYEADGFESVDDMLTGLRRFYPRMTPSSTVTVIHWDGEEGRLVELEDVRSRLHGELNRETDAERWFESPARLLGGRSPSEVLEAGDLDL